MKKKEKIKVTPIKSDFGNRCPHCGGFLEDGICGNKHVIIF